MEIRLTSHDINIMRGYELGDSDFDEISSEITSVDESDGGCIMKLVVQRKSDDIFFGGEVTQWELDDENEAHEFTQVFKKTKEVTYYE